MTKRSTIKSATERRTQEPPPIWQARIKVRYHLGGSGFPPSSGAVIEAESAEDLVRRFVEHFPLSDNGCDPVRLTQHNPAGFDLRTSLCDPRAPHRRSVEFDAWITIRSAINGLGEAHKIETPYDSDWADLATALLPSVKALDATEPPSTRCWSGTGYAAIRDDLAMDRVLKHPLRNRLTSPPKTAGASWRRDGSDEECPRLGCHHRAQILGRE